MAQLDQYTPPNLIGQEMVGFVVTSHQLPPPVATPGATGFSKNPIPRGTIVCFDEPNNVYLPATEASTANGTPPLFGIVVADAPNTAAANESASVAVKGSFLEDALSYDDNSDVTGIMLVKLLHIGIVVSRSTPA